MGEGVVEDFAGRFVGAGVFGGDDLVEFGLEACLGLGEEVAIDVGDDDEFEVLLEGLEGLDCVGEGWP